MSYLSTKDSHIKFRTELCEIPVFTIHLQIVKFEQRINPCEEVIEMEGAKQM